MCLLVLILCFFLSCWSHPVTTFIQSSAHPCLLCAVSSWNCFFLILTACFLICLVCAFFHHTKVCLPIQLPCCFLSKNCVLSCLAFIVFSSYYYVFFSYYNMTPHKITTIYLINMCILILLIWVISSSNYKLSYFITVRFPIQLLYAYLPYQSELPYPTTIHVPTYPVSVCFFLYLTITTEMCLTSGAATVCCYLQDL
jgi:hypothetical protein